MNKQSWIDRIGVLTSSFCAVHCLLMPLLIGVLPLMSLNVFMSYEFEWFMIGIAGVIGSMGVTTGYRVHTRFSAVILFAFGIFILVTNRVYASTTGAPCCDIHSVPEESNYFPVMLSVIGGGLVASSHIVNQYLCKQCSSCNRASCKLN